MNEVKTITGPSPELLTVAEAKDYLKIDHADEDALLAVFIAAAREQIQRWCGIAIGEQTLEWITDFPTSGTPQLGKYLPRRNCYEVLNQKKEMPYPPFIELVSAQLWNDTAYEAQTVNEDFKIFEGTFDPFQTGGWKITYKTGYTSADLPAGLKLIWRQLVAYLYTNRQEEDVQMPGFIRYALQPYKRSLI